MTDFHDVSFPLSLALSTSGGPLRQTEIVALTNGREVRNARQALGRRHYDAGSALLSLDDLYLLTEFFEARQGELHAFRFRDPVDFQTCRPSQLPGSADQLIGTGDGVSNIFQLVRAYGTSVRPITKPVAGSVRMSIGGSEIAASAFTVEAVTGLVTLETIPSAGAEIRAGFVFDVPVRFATSRIDIALSAFSAGRIPSIPLIEVL